MIRPQFLFPALLLLISTYVCGQTSPSPSDIRFVRQGVKRMVFDPNQAIPLASLDPEKVIGMASMHPVTHYLDHKAEVTIREDLLAVRSESESRTAVWFGGFNPFATYTIDLAAFVGEGDLGFEFSPADKSAQFFVNIGYKEGFIDDAVLKITREGKTVIEKSIATNFRKRHITTGTIVLQMLGSGLNLYLQSKGLPLVIGQSDFNQYLDLRKKECISSFQSSLYLHLKSGEITVRSAKSMLGPGMGLADIRAITYEDGAPLLNQGRLWYTMSIRGRALPHHLQGVFSMDPTVFDIKLEGVVVFDRSDGLLRNEIASHIFYDRKESVWRGLTTGFSAYANPGKEKKQLLTIESRRDPRFGFSVMQATPFGMVGDIEDPHLLFDEEAGKWRMLTCENRSGYKAIMLESDHWDRDYQLIAGPVEHNSTGVSIQKIGNKRYCFSGSSERKVLVYTYPDLKEAGTLDMDLPPWDDSSRTRIWPNVVEAPEGFPFRYVALMMDRYNYPGLEGPNWTYGALYLYHGYEK